MDMEKDRNRENGPETAGSGISAILSCIYAVLALILLFRVPFAALLLGIGSVVAGILGRKTPRKKLATIGLAAGAAITLFILIGFVLALGTPA